MENEGDEKEVEERVSIVDMLQNMSKRLGDLTSDVENLKKKGSKGNKKPFVAEIYRRMEVVGGNITDQGDEEDGSDSEEVESESEEECRKPKQKNPKSKRQAKNKRRKKYLSSSEDSSSDSDASETSSDEERNRRHSRAKKKSGKQVLKEFWGKRDRRKHNYIAPIINRAAEEKLCFVLMDFNTVTQYVKAQSFNNERNKRDCEVVAQSIDLILAELGVAKGRKLDVVEVLVRRLVQVQAADHDRTWDTAKHMFQDESSIALATGKELRAARKQAKVEKDS